MKIKTLAIAIAMLCVGVQGYAQHHRGHYHPVPHHHHYSVPYYHRVYPYYAPRYYVPRTQVVTVPVVVNSSSYRDDVYYNNEATQKSASININGVKITRLSADRLQVNGKNKVVLDTTKSNNHVVNTKNGKVVVKTTGGKATITAYDASNNVIGSYEL